MSDTTAQRCALLAKFKDHVALERYASGTVRAYLAVAGGFLEFLSNRQVPIAEVQAGHLTESQRGRAQGFGRHAQLPTRGAA